MTTTQTISSQRYRDESIVQEKRESGDRVVSVVTIDLDGTEYRVVVDGHHSLQYCIDDGIEPELVEVTDSDTRSCADDDPQQWLENRYHDSDYYDILTGQDIW